ncbi:nucleotidyltransferase [Bacillus cereus]|uniref:Nucleotidyltransferase n=1 Tax=Bacillus cereus TaxID=1396 RepID=A0A2B0MQX6_BACCE|nr:nucleotidyltransferase [Bacillus cereus]
MSIQTYLNNLASDLVLSREEKDKVDTSITNLAYNLNRFFNEEIESHFKFGSYTRGTILPRKADGNSDIDYMVIFNNPYNYKPQTLLNHLRKFVEKYYSRSEVYRSHPTIVLELRHIKFELVPAKKDWLGNIYIPSPASSYEDWMLTDPNAFNEKLTRVNTSNGNRIKPLVRLMKYWNRMNGGHLSSYELENWIVNQSYFFCNNLKECVYHVFEILSYNLSDPNTYKQKVDRAKRIIKDVKYYEDRNMPFSAKQEMMKLFPDFE